MVSSDEETGPHSNWQVRILHAKILPENWYFKDNQSRVHDLTLGKEGKATHIGPHRDIASLICKMRMISRFISHDRHWIPLWTMDLVICPILAKSNTSARSRTNNPLPQKAANGRLFRLSSTIKGRDFV